ncbi:asparagine synthase (glutamine-hydrolyzing) [Magnetospirillum sp. 64-120]|uniref:asparagine synthase (glutamine-hydrolyzing) n=1 Tax=Magnetospirillum sp. 64-120 TaxID=1895778 RepID=UPI00092685CE|nr:asparagine synthase (glutamine-hydrolyzing) [Magnetospirillum sp. 64-120]OJX77738.1 MAG: asparagine synthase (glutamine-hydrolyzing) [Magnetospirillum sp. 64-120]
MCGIAGLVGWNGQDDLADIATAMLTRIGHRGPDGLGAVIGDDWALGAVRLAILDIAAGQQPISDDSGRFWLAYNGEIYNYRELRAQLEASGAHFHTQCDTEVLLQAWIHWGEACLDRLNGGYAFALYDRLESRLILARDRFGKRPLFTARHGGALLFASEMKAFLAVPGFHFRQDAGQIASILGTWTPLPDQSGFTGIAQLPMGMWMSVDAQGMTQHSYAPLAFADGPAPADETEAKQMIRQTLTRAVDLRLRSDVEVGVYLSGGIDSAIVAALATDLNGRPPATFSVTFDDASLDESPEQQAVSAALGTRHQALRIAAADIVDACPQAVYHAEVPTFRSAFVPMFLLSRATQQAGIKVILSGEGADEAFLGYDLFKETLLRSTWTSMDEDTRRQRLGRLYPHLDHYGPQDIAALTGLYQQFASETMPGLFSHEIKFQNGRFSARLVKGAGDPFAAITALVAQHPELQAMSPVQKAQWLEYKTLLPGYLLSTQGDRAALAHGVENRCPFLDPAVLDLASSINLRFDDGFDEKRLLRQAFADRLPDCVVNKRKFPYRAPDAAAFAAAHPDYMDLLLSDSELAKLDYLDAGFAKRLCAKVLTKPASEISTKENQTFLFLLSLALLHHAFVARQELPGHGLQRPAPPLMRMVDLRSRA